MMKIIYSFITFFYVFIFLCYSVVGHSYNSFSDKLEKYQSIKSLNDEIEREIERRKINIELGRTKRESVVYKNKTSINTLELLDRKAQLKILTNETAAESGSKIRRKRDRDDDEYESMKSRITKPRPDFLFLQRFDDSPTFGELRRRGSNRRKFVGGRKIKNGRMHRRINQRKKFTGKT